MKTLAFIWPFPPEARTAAAVRLAGFLKAAGEVGILAVAITPQDQGRSEAESAQGTHVRIALYDSLSAHLGPVAAALLFPSSTVNLLRVVRDRKCDGVVASTPTPIVPLQGLLASRLLGLPYVLDVRDSWEMEKATHRGRIRNAVKERIERICATFADTVLCVTPRLAKRVQEHYRLEDSKVQVVPNGADLDEFTPGNGRDIDLVFVGTPAPYRNPIGLLEAVARIGRVRPNVSARLVGWGDAPQTLELTSYARRLTMPSSVHFVPRMPHDQIPSLIQRSRLGMVSLSSDDRFRTAVGAKTYEYLACGVPLACLGPAGDSELRSLVEGKGVGFFATSPTEFASEAMAILEDPERWRHLCEVCKRLAPQIDRRKISQGALRDIIGRLIAN